MKSSSTAAKLLIFLCSAFISTAVFGQNTFTYTNANGADIGLAASWNPNGLPSGATQDNAQWDGVTPGDLVLNYNSGWGNSGFGTSGINLVCTANQIGSVTITSSGNSPAAGIFGITNNSPSGILRIGDNTTHFLNLATRPGNSGTVHGFVNNSSRAAIMDSSVIWVAGGGVACVMDFSGTGDWIVNHNLRQNNSGAGPITVNWEGPGTLTWSPGGVWLASDAIGPITINSGTVVLKGPGLCPSFTIFTSGTGPGNNAITNMGALKFDVGSQSDNISRVISGTGLVQVVTGTLTLSGANTYSGNNILSGGELIAGAPELAGTSGPLGTNNQIVFAGGTLGFSGNNTFDYSSRFSTAAGQAYSIDTAGQSVTFAAGLSSSGGTLSKLGAGTLTLVGASSFSGLTTVSVGTLAIQGTKSGLGNITVANGADLAISENGSLITPATLTLGTSAGVTLEFNNVTNTSTATLAAGTISSGGTVIISVNSGVFNTTGQTFPLLSWTSGSAPAVTLGSLNGAGGFLSTNGNTIQLTITDPPYIWSGGASGNWDTTTSGNWIQSGNPVTWANGHFALLDDTAITTNITLAGVIQPVSATVSDSVLNYGITSSAGNDIGGSANVIKSGSATLTLSGGANAYTGKTTINGGTVSVATLANGGSASDIGAAGSGATNVVLSGGTLQYTGGGASIDRLFSVGLGGGTIDSSGSGALNLNNGGAVGLSGSGPRSLTLTGSGTVNTLAAAISDSSGGATALTKSGTSVWILTGTNTYSGGTTIASGSLQVGAGGASGTVGSGGVVNNGGLDFNRTGTLTVSGPVSGSGPVTNDGSGTVILANNNNYVGGTYINAGTLQIGNAGGTGTLDSASPIVDNGTIIFNSTGNLTISGIISGTGNVIKRGSGLLKFLGANSYTGTTTVDAGAQLQLAQGNTGANASSAITNNGTVIVMRQETGLFIYAGNISGTGKYLEQVSNGNFGDATLTGTNTYTGGTYILGGGVVVGDNGITPFGGSIVGNVFLTNDYIHATFGPFIPATITFNRAEDITFAGNIVGDGNLVQSGSGTLTLTGNNTFTNGAAINNGALQAGNGGAAGGIGTGTVTDNTTLIFNRSDNVTWSNVISGGGQLVKMGAGKLTLAATNTYASSTTVSNGTLFINADNSAVGTIVYGGTLGGSGTLGGPVILQAGTTLAPGAGLGTFTVNNDLSIGGNLAIEVNKSLAQSNDLVIVSGLLTNTGTGTLTVANLGPKLAVGDKFTLFSQPVGNGAALTVVGSAANWINNLAVDGSISVGSLLPPPPLSFSRSGNNLTFSWTGNWKLLAQTNGLNVGLSNNWSVYPGGGSSPVTVPMNVATNRAVFFGLAPNP